VLIAANLVATVIRFLLYRHWVFGRPKRAPDAKHAPDAWLAGRQPIGAIQDSEMATQGERTT
jgi:hypothetical protein